MIGIWSAHSIIFTKIVAISLFVSFCVPMILVPMKWAKVLQWTIPDHNHLAVYFGRCLGGMAAILALFGWRATTEPGVLPFFFDLLIWIYLALALVHVWGALKRIQPITETIEIGFWVGLIVLSLCFYPIP
jgi:hypothetical protein